MLPGPRESGCPPMITAVSALSASFVCPELVVAPKRAMSKNPASPANAPARMVSLTACSLTLIPDRSAAALDAMPWALGRNGGRDLIGLDHAGGFSGGSRGPCGGAAGGGRAAGVQGGRSQP